MLTFFPDAWGGDKNAPTCPTPTGARCLFCNEPIRAEDRGVFMPHFGGPGEARDEPQHQRCFLNALAIGIRSEANAVKCDTLSSDHLRLQERLAEIAAGLLRLPGGTQEELREQLKGEMSSYSEENWSAGWLHDLEFRLWSSLMDDENDFAAQHAKENPHVATMNLRLWRIGQLALRVDGWFAWDEDWREKKDYTTGARFVPMVEWLPRYAAWRAKNPKTVTRAATQAEWEAREAHEREDAQHWCQHAEPPASCDTCKGSCSCHWREG